MIFTAVVMALLTVGGFAFEFYKLPVRLRMWLSRRYILLDALLAWITFAAIGFSVVGIMAAGMISIGVTIYLKWYKEIGYKKDEVELQQRKGERKYV